MRIDLDGTVHVNLPVVCSLAVFRLAGLMLAWLEATMAFCSSIFLEKSGLLLLP